MTYEDLYFDIKVIIGT